MKTKNIFRMILMAALLLVGVNGAKAVVLYDNPSGSGSYGTVNFPFGTFDNAAIGDELHVTYDILPQNGWTPTYQLQLGNVQTVTVTGSGTYVFKLDANFFQNINTTDQYNNCTFITPLWTTIYKIELVSGGVPAATQYTLTYIVDGQSTSMQVAEGAAITLPTPAKEGYAFTGWSNLPDDGIMPGNDLTVTALFSINSYSLTYKVDGVVYGEVETKTYGAAITPRDEPTREGYTFSGWSTIPATMPAHDVEVTGTFSKDKEYVNITIGYAGYATFSSTKAIDFGSVSGLDAFYAKNISDDVVTLAAVSGAVAANTGLLLKGAAGTYRVEVVESGSTISGNLFVAVATETIISASNKYVLTNEGGEVKFADTDAHQAVVPAGKAYLQGPASNGSRQLKVRFSGTTGLWGINAEDDASKAIYDLRGVRVKAPAKGLYIVNGKKVFFK